MALRKFPHPEEAAKRPSRRTHDADPAPPGIPSQPRKPESITTGGGIEPIASPSASMAPGLRRDDNEMVRRGISPDRDRRQAHRPLSLGLFTTP